MSDSKIALLSESDIKNIALEAAKVAAVKFGIHVDENAWSYEQCAKYLGCKRSHLTSLVANNLIPHFRIGKLVRFHPHEIRQWPGVDLDKMKQMKEDEILKRIRPGWR